MLYDKKWDKVETVDEVERVEPVRLEAYPLLAD
jgi:hypothetical protein